MHSVSKSNIINCKKIGNVNSLRLGATMLLIASVALTFGKTFIACYYKYNIINKKLRRNKNAKSV